jgi:hypothetical protein
MLLDDPIPFVLSILSKLLLRKAERRLLDRINRINWINRMER